MAIVQVLNKPVSCVKYFRITALSAKLYRRLIMCCHDTTEPLATACGLPAGIRQIRRTIPAVCHDHR